MADIFEGAPEGLGAENGIGGGTSEDSPEGIAEVEAGNVGGKADGEPKVALFGRDVPRKRLFVAAGIAAAVLLAGIGGCAVLSRQPEPAATGTQQEASQASTEEAEPEAKTMYVNVGVAAEGWDESTSSPVIAHIESDDGDVDFYHAYSANKVEVVAVGDESACKVTYISPVNADGSIYKVGETKSLASSDEKTSDATATTTTLEKVDAGSVTAGDLTNIATQVTEAVKKGDSTLTGDKGSQVVSKVEENIKNSPAATDDVKQSVEQQAGQAQEEAKKEETTAKVPATSGGSSSSGSSTSSGSGSSSGNTNSGSGQSSSQGGNTSQGGSSQQGSGSQGGNSQSGGSSPQHQHSWVHHDAEYTTVHHDAETHQVWHEGTKTTTTVCNQCGAVLGNDDDAIDSHFRNSLLNGGNCSSYTYYHNSTPGFYETIVDKAAWDEQVQTKAAWDEQVQTKAAYDSCSCGATK